MRKKRVCLDVLVATVDEEIYRGRASCVVVPSQNGELAIMPHHSPLLAMLRPGILRIDCLDEKKGGECHPDAMVVFGGFLEVQPDAVIVLADAVERTSDMNEAQAKHAVALAKQKLKTSRQHDSYGKALIELEVAIAKLRVTRRNSRESFMKRSR